MLPGRKRLAAEAESWRLRLASNEDVGSLHDLLSHSKVRRHLCDEAAPAPGLAATIVAWGSVNVARLGIGLWILEGSEGAAGFVSLDPVEQRAAELT